MESGFQEMVTDYWHMHLTHYIIPKLSASADDVSVWSKNHCNKLKSDIEECYRQLKNICVNSVGPMQS